MRTVYQSKHYQQVRKFMKGISSQGVPDRPGIPDEKTRLLRARLILEEALELIGEGLGVEVTVSDREMLCLGNLTFDCEGPGDLVEIADGCADVSVVTTGTLIACGIPDRPLLKMVDRNNLEKLKNGTISLEGKLIKPPGHQPPNIAALLSLLDLDAEEELIEKVVNIPNYDDNGAKETT